MSQIGFTFRFLRYGRILCDDSVRVVEIVRTRCNFSNEIVHICKSALSTSVCVLHPKYPNFAPVSSCINARVRSRQPLFTIHAMRCGGTIMPTTHMESRFFSTQEAFESFLKMQAGVFKALSESTVVGYAKDSIMFVHEITGLPWWCSIMLTTVILRTFFTLPFTLYQNFILAKVENLTLEMPQIAKQLGMETTYAIKKLNWTEAQAKIAYRRSLKKQWNKLIVRDNCHPAKAGIVLWVQMSLWIIYSTALRNMVFMLPDNDLAARLLNLELSVGGTLWFPNLTMADSSLILPITFGLVNLIIIELQEITRVKKTSKLQKYATNFFRVLSVVMVPIAAGVPSCLCLYWVTSSMTGLVHNLVLLSPRMRRLSGIPLTPSELVHPYLHVRKELQRRLSFKAKVEKQ